MVLYIPVISKACDNIALKLQFTLFQVILCCVFDDYTSFYLEMICKAVYMLSERYLRLNLYANNLASLLQGLCKA